MNEYKKLLIKNRELIIAEIAERMKDVIYVNAEKQARYVFENVIMKHVHDGEDSIEVVYEFTFVMNDLFQIAVRGERIDREDEIKRLERLIAGHHNVSEVEKIRNGLFCPICLKEEKRLQERKNNEKDKRIQKNHYQKTPGTQRESGRDDRGIRGKGRF